MHPLKPDATSHGDRPLPLLALPLVPFTSICICFGFRVRSPRWQRRERFLFLPLFSRVSLQEVMRSVCHEMSRQGDPRSMQAEMEREVTESHLRLLLIAFYARQRNALSDRMLCSRRACALTMIATTAARDEMREHECVCALVEPRMSIIFSCIFN